MCWWGGAVGLGGGEGFLFVCHPLKSRARSALPTRTRAVRSPAAPRVYGSIHSVVGGAWGGGVVGSCVRCDVRRVFLRALSHPRLFLHTPLVREGEPRNCPHPPPPTHTLFPPMADEWRGVQGEGWWWVWWRCK